MLLQFFDENKNMEYESFENDYINTPLLPYKKRALCKVTHQKFQLKKTACFRYQRQ